MEELIKLNAYPVKGLLKKLLQDKTTKKNIIFASDSYESYGYGFTNASQMTEDALLGFESCDIQPRVYKSQSEQGERTRKRAEVFTPAWVVKKMNDQCDPEINDWQKYIDLRYLEITCGEAPFIVSRYDTTSGDLIPIGERIGILDRKLRVVGDNANDEETWLKWAFRAFESVYGYEYQGDNLLIARINLLQTFCDYLQEKWQRQAADKELSKLCNIICWNFWQMDGLTDTVPNGIPESEFEQLSLFEMTPSQNETPLCRVYDWRAGKSLTFAEIKNGGCL